MATARISAGLELLANAGLGFEPLELGIRVHALHIHQIGNNQQEFADFAARELLPRL